MLTHMRDDNHLHQTGGSYTIKKYIWNWKVSAIHTMSKGLIGDADQAFHAFVPNTWYMFFISWKDPQELEIYEIL